MPKVVVVGAGPAGSICAGRLAAAGLDVTLLERTPFPRIKVCGEYLNSAAQAELDLLGLAPRIAAACNAIEGIRLTIAGLQIELPFAAPAWSIERSALDDMLLGYARRAGADALTGRAGHVSRNGTGLTVGFRDASGFDRTLKADVVVGADGLGSLVARKLGLAAAGSRRSRFAVGGHYAGFGNLGRFIEMYVDRHAYFAVNPLSADLANVMLVVDQKDLHAWSGAFDERMQQTAARLTGGQRTIAALRRVGKRVAIGPLSHRVRAVADANVYLVGDAAGFVDPFTGQGVYLALYSAKLAADAIVSELRDKHRAEQIRAKYACDHERVFAGRRRLALLVSFLSGTPWLSKRAVANLKRNASLRCAVMQAIAGTSPPGAALDSKTLLRLVS